MTQAPQQGPITPSYGTLDLASQDSKSAAPRRFLPKGSLRIHIWAAVACIPLLLACIGGAVRLPNSGWEDVAVGSVLLTCISMLPALLWHDRKDYEKRDAALMLPWLILLVAMIPFLTTLAIRLGFPLRDDLYARWDNALGLSVPQIMAWTTAHSPVDQILTASYRLLRPFLILAIFLPASLGKKQAAERFALANIFAYLVALPLFALLPAVGPWTVYHFAGNPAQVWTEAAIQALRSGGTSEPGLGCFPSYHAMWAIFSASAFWPFKFLRVPAVVLAVLIVISTVTTGWHYGVDAISGVVVALLCLALAFRLADSNRHPQS